MRVLVTREGRRIRGIMIGDLVFGIGSYQVFLSNGENLLSSISLIQATTGIGNRYRTLVVL